MKLSKLLQGVAVLESTAAPDMEITGINCDSRTTQNGDLFAAVTGFATDGHKYIPTAIEKGAKV
ncbi:MAG: UDP-N-acetylmuramoyl-L-alanyl-D-glutamate--2,6-diaminopimelate ligase, partial [Oscillospiraceae bacterium]|nr:UDP-N-acetylmuramoyl-L-alanyl-D-glutamate--2,6-diaminopimelate ligase [Oscillospiraceae bacterium]